MPMTPPVLLVSGAPLWLGSASLTMAQASVRLDSGSPTPDSLGARPLDQATDLRTQALTTARSASGPLPVMPVEL